MGPRPAREDLGMAALGRRHRPDYWLVALAVTLLVIGLIVIYSISPALSAVAHVSSNYYVLKQLLSIGLGLAAFVVASQLPIANWQQLAKPFALLAAVSPA